MSLLMVLYLRIKGEWKKKKSLQKIWEQVRMAKRKMIDGFFTIVVSFPLADIFN